MHSTLVTIGRVLLGFIFVGHGLMLAKLAMDPQATAGFVGYIGSRGVPQPQLIFYATIAFEIIAGLAIMIGFMVTPIALALAVFSIAIALIYHNFWSLPAERFVNEVAHFVKDIGIGGAFLVLAGEGIRVRTAKNAA